MSDLLLHLNPEQLAAVTLPPENALILAGAGSGKTRVLTTRIAWLISTGQVSPAGVLAVTFTNKAAKEMLTRLSAMLPMPVRGMWVGTFHGLCNRFLRAHWKTTGLPQTFQILDTQDQLSAVKRLLKGLNVDEQRAPPKQVLWFINGMKEQGLRAKDCEVRDAQSRLMAEVYAAYEAQCQREGVADFAELLLRTYEVLRDHAEIRQHYRARFRHVLIDEFQDTNRLQYQWLKLLAGPDEPQPSAVVAVGDDDQSIYAFRGANVGNMDDYQREFHVHHLIKLEHNYRSHANILDTANHLIAHNNRRLGKNLRTEAGAGEPVRVIEQPSDHQEAAWLVEEIRLLLRGGCRRDQIALLYRSNAQSRVIEGALFNAAIPYKVYGGLRFFERAEIKHALAYLRLLDNPLDDTAFLRVANFPPRGIGARTLEQLQDAARLRQVPLAEAISALGGRGAASLQAFIDLLAQAKHACTAMSLPDLVRHLLDVSGLLEHYRHERDGQDRVENLEELVNAATAFVTQEGFGLDAEALRERPLSDQALQNLQAIDPATGETLSPLTAFLTHAALEAGDNQAQAGQDAVQMMTVHAAKGLEFDAVFITGLEEGLFPHENAMNEADGVEEERRLMYVAITRARKRLYLSHAQSRILHGQTRYNLRSRFFDELPEETLKWLSPKAGKPASSYAPSLGSAWSDEAAVPFTPSAASLPVAGHGLRVGQSVFHTKFGEGVILTLEGQSLDARAQVQFKRHGLKWLALNIAKLTPVN
ncbi:MAG: UvrD-helicase domain-containing protein [Betaproteobacteria bacterium]|nr:UvrD-helicase domain-containing protein [Betaproteobacteria bacterium]MDE2122902.1 UvrD-helicase domain-containing protein [Betaproteobacteria bacterium]MDE2186413.1 UvrD-helicase domain-containing protein [Betaproteobacteria bacterium]MDE2325222.1 UvrD-helicase domain-containing protein [Betaproteobacteria bacterium]